MVSLGDVSSLLLVGGALLIANRFGLLFPRKEEDEAAASASASGWPLSLFQELTQNQNKQPATKQTVDTVTSGNQHIVVVREGATVSDVAGAIEQFAKQADQQARSNQPASGASILPESKIQQIEQTLKMSIQRTPESIFSASLKAAAIQSQQNQAQAQQVTDYLKSFLPQKSYSSPAMSYAGSSYLGGYYG